MNLYFVSFKDIYRTVDYIVIARDKSDAICTVEEAVILGKVENKNLLYHNSSKTICEKLCDYVWSSLLAQNAIQTNLGVILHEIIRLGFVT